MNLKHLPAIVRFTRPTNLIIIALVLCLQRWCIVMPGIGQHGAGSGWAAYGFMVLGSVLIAAGGYLVNDFFDKEIDAVNRPQKAASLGAISPGALKAIYLTVTLAGLISIACACFLAGIYAIWLFYFLTVVLLFWYSYRLKKVLILGNFVVAIVSAFIMPAAWLFDLLRLQEWSFTGFPAGNVYSGITVYVIIYSIFAFLISFAREIIKDIEDREGDSLSGCRSLPVVYGLPVAKSAIITSFGLILILLSCWQVDLFGSGRTDMAAYLALAVDLPLIGLSVYVIRMRTKTQSHMAGLITKMIMVTGILSMIWFRV